MLFSALICACGEYKLEEESTNLKKNLTKGKHRKMSRTRFKSLPEARTTPKSTIRSHYSYSMKKGNASKKKPFPTNPLRIATICLRGNTP